MRSRERREASKSIEWEIRDARDIDWILHIICIWISIEIHIYTYTHIIFSLHQISLASLSKSPT